MRSTPDNVGPLFSNGADMTGTRGVSEHTGEKAKMPP